MKNAKNLFLTIAAAALSAVPAGGAAAEGTNAFTVYGEGLTGCRDYVFLREDSQGEYSWLAGFMSAAGLSAGTKKPLNEVADMYLIEERVAKYCKANPLRTLSDAAEQVAADLIEAAGRQ